MIQLPEIVLLPQVVRDIADIGWSRWPQEACGVLLPEPFNGQQVFQVANLSTTPETDFKLSGESIVAAIAGWIENNPDQLTWGMIAIWHTHPQGQIGPSRNDLHLRSPHCGNLVVALRPDGQEPIATWF